MSFSKFTEFHDPNHHPIFKHFFAPKDAPFLLVISTRSHFMYFCPDILTIQG